ncbi:MULTISPECIES: hypothetical protein [unclassified Streptomyces]|uniref:hypothetical protein n=1 Tax=unclassified Streptomyces TaxID=2593676 RepID=UPI003870B6F8
MFTDLGRMSVFVGRPVGEGPDLLVWNNWIGRSDEETVQARQDWMEGTRDGEVKGYDGPPIPAPQLPPVPLKALGRVR